MSTTKLPLSIGVTELTLADGSVTELVMSSVVDNKPYYDLAFAAAKVYTDAQDAAYLVTAQNEFTAADAVVLSSANTYTDTSSSNAITTAETFATAGDTAAKAFAIQRANHTGTQSVSTITGLAAVATSGLKADVGLSNVANLAPIDMPVSTAQATADTATLNSAKSYADSLVVGLFDFRGDYNASGNKYPTSSNNGSGSAGAVLKADVWRISVQGTLQGKTARVGDLLTAVVDNPAQTDANWTLTSNELAYTPENTANKATNLSSNDSTHYPTTAAVQTAINTREPSITASVVTSFWSGTKTFRDLATDVRAVVLTGLSTATGTAITAADSILIGIGKLQAQVSAKLDATANAVSATKLNTARNINGVAFDGTTNITIADSTKEPSITGGTTAQYWRGDKSWQTLAQTVDALTNVTITSKATNDLLQWNGTAWINKAFPAVGIVGNSLMRPTQSKSSASGVLTIDLSQPYEVYTVTLTENITSWSFTNLPAAGFTAELRVVITQSASTAYTVANPISGGVYGGFSPNSSVLSSVESWGLVVTSAGIIGMFQSGVKA